MARRRGPSRRKVRVPTILAFSRLPRALRCVALRCVALRSFRRIRLLERTICRMPRPPNFCLVALADDTKSFARTTRASLRRVTNYDRKCVSREREMSKVIFDAFAGSPHFSKENLRQGAEQMKKRISQLAAAAADAGCGFRCHAGPCRAAPPQTDKGLSVEYHRRALFYHFVERLAGPRRTKELDFFFFTRTSVRAARDPIFTTFGGMASRVFVSQDYGNRGRTTDSVRCGAVRWIRQTDIRQIVRDVTNTPPPRRPVECLEMR
ncbi:hypothetical protein V9T40_000188 [Parthenolecanium corni]|uniref:Uncharacterized protein n=1 Tax=Parthenolecanium corni TaxID=536013 RepID=A0AAN9TAQ5_9HEMI